MIAYAGEILASTATHHDYAVLLDIVSCLIGGERGISHPTLYVNRLNPRRENSPDERKPPRNVYGFPTLFLYKNRRLHIPSPGIYPHTILPVDSLIFATFLSALFGFLGFIVLTFVHTPFSCGRPTIPGETGWRGFFGFRGARRICIRVEEGEGVVEKG